MTAPLPYPLLQRVPEDQPFVVRHSRLKRGLFVGSLVAVLELMALCLFGLALVGDDTADGSAHETMLVAGGMAVFFLVFFGGSFLLMTRGGPILAVGPAGLWIRTRPVFGQAVWLPWEAIALISRRRWGIEKVLVVRPRDPRVQSLGRYSANGGGSGRMFYSSGFTATLNLADRPEAEILQAVAYYAANRVALT